MDGRDVVKSITAAVLVCPQCGTVTPLLKTVMVPVEGDLLALGCPVVDCGGLFEDADEDGQK